MTDAGMPTSRMNGRPKLLDLFSGAGGAGMGYHLAGFDVTGVDIKPQPRYPFDHVVGDARAFVAEHGGEYDAIHASPPCQAYTTMSNRWRGAGGKADSHDELIDATRSLLEQSGRSWVIENVAGARRAMRSPLTLTGGMFGLGVHRPRLFETSFLVFAEPPCPPPADAVGVYGKAHDGRRLFTRADGSIQRAANSLAEAQAAMGIDWMEWRELAEAIPPAYTTFLGEQLIGQLEAAAA